MQRYLNGFLGLVVLFVLGLSNLPCVAEVPPQQQPVTDFEALYQLSLRHNPDLVVLQKSLNVSQQDITIAGYIPNPTFSFYWGWGKLTSQLGNPNQVGLQETIEIGPKRKLRTLQAKIAFEQDKTGLQQAIWQLRSNLRLAYLDYLSTLSQQEQLEQQYVLVNQLIHIADVRFKAGSAPEAELIQAELGKHQLDPDAIQLKGQLAQNQWKLAQWAGQSALMDLPLNTSQVALLEQIPFWQSALPLDASNTLVNTLKELGFEHRQELKVALQQVEQSRVQWRAAKLNRIPDPQLGGGFLFVNSLSPVAKTLQDKREPFYGGFASINVPLPVFHNEQGEIRKALAQLQSDESSVDATRFSIESAIRQAVVAIETQQNTLENYRQQLIPRSIQMLQLADLGYRYGKTGLANVILARQAYQAVQLNYLKTLSLAWRAWAMLEQQTGLPLEELLVILPWPQAQGVYKRPSLPSSLGSQP